jgi:hypothetical protein
VGLGDSFSSGEGNPLYEPATATSQNQCHRSLQWAYPVRLRSPIDTPLGSVFSPATSPVSLLETVGLSSWDFVACSGARTANVTTIPQYPFGPPDNLAQLNRAGSVQTDLVTITIGGNDAEFAEILDVCVRRSNCPDRTVPVMIDAQQRSWENFLPAHLDTTVRLNVRSAIQAIKQKVSPATTILVMGYPNLLAESLLPAPCVAVSLLFGVVPIGFEVIDASERLFIRENTARMNAVLADEAELGGVGFVPVAPTYAGHELCGEDDPWIIAPSRFTLAENFHPNRNGQRAMSFVVSAALPGTLP